MFGLISKQCFMQIRAKSLLISDLNHQNAEEFLKKGNKFRFTLDKYRFQFSVKEAGLDVARVPRWL